MILSMSNQAVIFLTTAIIGVVIGFIYDLFRVFRKIVPHNDIFTYLEDAVYWVIVSIIMFYVMLNKNYGEIRFFSIFGAFLGMIIYFYTISRLFMKVSVAVVNFLVKVLKLLFDIIMAPFRLIYKLLYNPIMICKKRIKKVILGGRKVLHKSKNYAKIKKKKAISDIRIILKKV